MSGLIFITDKANQEQVIDEMNRKTREWTMQAARGECGWVCADCSCSFSDGMPDTCVYGHQRCTDIIKRDKARAQGSTPEAPEKP